MIEPFAENVKGDFYVAKDCCTLCDVPIEEAPKLFQYAKDSEGCAIHCFVCRQPENEQELDDMLRAMVFSEMQCIRYRGNEAGVMHKLIEKGHAELCDSLPNEDNVE